MADPPNPITIAISAYDTPTHLGLITWKEQSIGAVSLTSFSGLSTFRRPNVQQARFSMGNYAVSAAHDGHDAFSLSVLSIWKET